MPPASDYRHRWHLMILLLDEVYQYAKRLKTDFCATLCNRVKYVFCDFCRARAALALQSFLAIFGRECLEVFCLEFMDFWAVYRSLARDEAIPRDTRRAAKLLIYLFIYLFCYIRVKTGEIFLFASRQVVKRTTSMRKLMIINDFMCTYNREILLFLLTLFSALFNSRLSVNSYCCRLRADDASKRERTAIVGNRMNFWLKQWMKRGNGKRNSRCRSWEKFMFNEGGDSKISS